MRRQLRRLGLGFDNRRTFATIDDDYYRWTQWIFLQIWDAWYDEDAVREDGGRGKARPISELVEEFESGRRAVARRRRPPAGPSCPRPSGEGRSRATASPTPSEAPVNWCPGLGHGALQRGGHQRGPLRARQLPGLPSQPQPVDDADHGLRRPAGRRPRRRRLAREGQAHAAQLDRAVQGCPRHASPSSPARARRTASTSSRRAPTRSSARPSWSSRPSTRSSTRLSRQGGWPEGTHEDLEGGGRRRDGDPAGGRRRHTSSPRPARVTSSGRPRARTRPVSSPARGPRIP